MNGHRYYFIITLWVDGKLRRFKGTSSKFLRTYQRYLIDEKNLHCANIHRSTLNQFRTCALPLINTQWDDRGSVGSGDRS